MTLEEARIIARIIGTADSGCSSCVGALVERMNEKFPEFKFKMLEKTVVEYLDKEGNQVGENDDWDGSEWYKKVMVEPLDK